MIFAAVETCIFQALTAEVNVCCLVINTYLHIGWRDWDIHLAQKCISRLKYKTY